MKIKHYFGLAVIAAMTASCSSNEDLGTAGTGTGTNEAGVSYATFTINLPTTSGTRSTENDQFNGGTASEYAVNDATLVIFEKAGASENDYTYLEAVSLGNLEPWKKDNESNNGITTEATITAKLNSAKVDKTGDKYYALVILNNEATTGNKVTTPSAKTETYGTWNIASKVTKENLLDNKKGFYMANAPEFTTGKEPTTLVAIKGIYRTKEEAQNNAATTIHVERGLAKVTVGSNSTSSTKDYFAEGGANATGKNYNSDVVQITKWALDVTNMKSFPVHVTSGLKSGISPTDPTDPTVPAYPDIWKDETGTAPATSRFVSHPAKEGAFKRVYWGIDPNYSKNLTDKAACGKEFTLVKADGSDADWKTSTEPLYCLENTFDIKHMMQGQTTRVVFKGTYIPKSITPDANGTFYKIGKNVALWNSTDLEKHILAAVTKVVADASAAGASTTINLNGSDNDLTKAGNRMLKASNITVTKVTGDVVTLQPEDVTAINNKLGLSEGYGISTYEKGESYYIARIKHFGDDLTPWEAGNDTYGENNLNWLGRYGVLRNNWYDLTVNSISGPGYPDIPEVNPTDPDDENFKYISVSVKILDWAKRSQSVDL